MAPTLTGVCQRLLEREVEGKILDPRLQGSKAVRINGRPQRLSHHLQRLGTGMAPR